MGIVVLKLMQNRSALVHALVISVLLSASVLLFLHVSRQYPYYFLWDMDATTAIDTVLVQSHELPSHINHPGFGMYLWLSLVHKAACALHYVSVLDLNDLSRSLNPLGGIVELTVFVKDNSAFLAAAISIVLWASVVLLFEVPLWISPFILLFFISQGNLFYHASMIRSEFYGVFYWCASVLCAAWASQGGSQRGRRIPILLAGVFLGLCYTTKFQGVLCVLLLPVFLLFFLRTDGEKQPWQERDTRRILSLANLLLFGALLVGAARVIVPPELVTFEANYGLSIVGCVFILIFIGLWISNVSVLNLLFSGFLLSFLLHFLIYSDLKLSLELLLLDAKMVFMRPIGNWNAALDPCSLWGSLASRPLIYAPNLILGLYACCVAKKQQRLLLVLSLLMIYLNVAIQRQALRDFIWTETPVLFSSAVFLFYLSVKKQAMGQWLALAVLVGLIGANIVYALPMPLRVDANFNIYGWQRDWWVPGVYAGHIKYKSIMLGRYGHAFEDPRRVAAKKFSDDFVTRRRTAQFVFPNQTITQRNLGPLSRGFPVWTDAPQIILGDLPAALEGSTVVDSRNLGTANTFFKSSEVSRHSDVPEKFNPVRRDGIIAVLTRSDLDVHLFVFPEDVAAIQDSRIRPTGLTVTLGDSKTTHMLKGMAVTSYSEIPKARLGRPFFFVIASHDRPFFFQSVER